MKKGGKLRIFFITLAIFLIISAFVFLPMKLTSFFTLSSVNYYIDSAISILSGGSSQSSGYSTTSYSGYQQPVSNAQSSSYNAKPGVFPTPATQTTTPTTPTTTPSGGGGGGSSTTTEQCTYDWVCTEWYPDPCPASEIQNKLCVNRGTCDGTSGMPETTRTCVYSPTEPLFDIFAKIPLAKKQITSQDVLEAEISVINAGEIKQLDVLFRYWIVDRNNKLITEMQETRAIKSKDKFTVRINLPPNIDIGNYKFFAQITYDDGKTAIANDSFSIISKVQLFTFFYVFAIAFLIVLFLTTFIAYKLFKNRRR